MKGNTSGVSVSLGVTLTKPHPDLMIVTRIPPAPTALFAPTKPVSHNGQTHVFASFFTPVGRTTIRRNA
jgi:hypothetical protein